MDSIKSLIKNKGYKKIAISRFLRTIPVDVANAKNAAALDVKYLQKYINEQCGNVTCDIILQNKKAGIESDNTIYFRDVRDINKYDLIIFQPYTFNLYTGVWEMDTVDFVDIITHVYKNSLAVIYNDPNVQWENPYPMMIKRPFLGKNIHDKHNPMPLYKSEEDVNRFNELNIIGLFNGKSWKDYWDLSLKKNYTVEPNYVININLSEWISFNMLKEYDRNLFNIINPIKDRKYDIVYYGSDRKGSRELNIKKIFKNSDSISKKWIGYDPNLCNTVVHRKKIEHSKLSYEIQECIFSLVMGDDAHNNNIITYRFFENTLFNTLSAIHISYDESRELIQDEELRKICYFENAEELNVKIEFLKNNPHEYKKYLKLQRNEVERISKNWKI